MPSLWITYAWTDNEDHDVDFLAQELGRAGLTVKLDRWNLPTGQRLWGHIADFISNPAQSDAWAIYATQRSLGSEACREELAYALDRALSFRSDVYPVIALFPGPVETSLLPASLRVRLCASTTDPGWKERIVAAVEHRAPAIDQQQVLPFVARAHPAPPPFKHVFEVRPRAGVWDPFIFAIPAEEKDRIGMTIRPGPPRRVPSLAGIVMERGDGITPDGKWYFCLGYEPATPTHSYYAFVREMPSVFGFGQEGMPGLFYTFDAPRIVA
jgi:hypothetical protein